MDNKVFISCAVTGSGDTANKHPDLPKTPKQIAEAAIESAKAGAAIAHIHVREEDGKPSRRIELYKEVVDRIRSSQTDVILNLTTGMGGDLDIGQGKNPLDFGPMTDITNIIERIANAEELLPEICTLDCGTLNFGDSSQIVVNTPNDIRIAAKRLKEIKVKPEIEAFDLGNMWFGAQLYKEGLLSDPPMFQMCLGIPWGAPATPLAMQAMKDIMPKEAIWSGFAISKNEMPFVAQTVILGGNPRVGLEDNLYLSKGKLATNPQLVEKAISIVNDLGFSVNTPEETRKKLKLIKHK
tara:strand:- start:4566 stop:5453 length:888 start_codon:yes stop_codon:yes gene_type:complete